MKKFRRLAALLLTGAMALMMFAGCNRSAFEAEVENELMKQFNALRSDVSTAEEPVPELQNDSALHQTAMKMLDRIDPESGLVDESEVGMMRFDYTSTKASYTEIYIYVHKDAHDGNNAVPVEITADTLSSLTIQNLIGYDLDQGNVEWFKTITAFTVAARTIGGKTYVACGFTYSYQ